jgi:hypothetical protein
MLAKKSENDKIIFDCPLLQLFVSHNAHQTCRIPGLIVRHVASLFWVRGMHPRFTMCLPAKNKVLQIENQSIKLNFLPSIVTEKHWKLLAIGLMTVFDSVIKSVVFSLYADIKPGKIGRPGVVGSSGGKTESSSHDLTLHSWRSWL